MESGKLTITRTQAKYVVDNQKVAPQLINKFVEIHPYYGSLFKKTHGLSEEPTHVLIYKILSRKGDEIHIWGAFEKDAKYHQSIYINKKAFKHTKQVKELVFDAYKRPPKPHQIEAVKTLLAHDKFILADDMGLGKTASSIIAAVEGGFQKILVVCPASLKLNWKIEISHYEDPSKITVVDGHNFSVNKWTIINYDILKNFHTLAERGKPKPPISPLDFHKFDLVIADEAHYLKNATAQRTKLFADFAERIPTRWLLSGTPITNKPIDFFSLLDICDSPLAVNWVGYVKRYCEGKQFKRKGSDAKFWVAGGASNLDELRRFSSELILRRTKKELNLPPKTKKPVYLPLSMSFRYSQYMAEYEQWVEQMEMLGEKLPVTAHLTKLTAVRQLLAQDKVDHTITMAKDYIEEGHKVIIFSCFTETLHTIYEHFGKEAVIIDGSVSSAKRQKAVESFQDNDKIKVFCGNIQAAGVGLTLTAADVVIFNDLDWVPANHMQAEDRCVAAGQPVMTSEGFKNIENVVIGDLVYTHLGNWKNVINTSTKLERTKCFVDIKYKGFDQPLTCTEDHKIYTYNTKTKSYGWVEAGDLKPNVHYLVFSKPNLTKTTDAIKLELPYGNDFNNNYGTIQANGRLANPYQRIQLTPELMFAFGWYLAEGWASVSSEKGSSVSVCGNAKDEMEMVGLVMDTIKTSFGLHNSKVGCYENNKNCVSAMLYSKNLAHNFLKWFDSGSKNKRIPEFVYTADPLLIGEFLKGYYAGDGYRRKNTQQATTASDNIAIGLCQLESHLDKPVTLRTTVKNHWSFEYSIPENTQRESLIKVAEEAVLYPISEISIYKPKRGKERVYDLTVQDDHSFTVGLSAVHNCHRIGQDKEVHIIYNLINDTIDNVIYDTLLKKMVVIHEVIGDQVDETDSVARELVKSLRSR